MYPRCSAAGRGSLTVRAGDGGLRHVCIIPKGDPEAAFLIEIWRDPQSLYMHHASPLME